MRKREKKRKIKNLNKNSTIDGGENGEQNGTQVGRVRTNSISVSANWVDVPVTGLILPSRWKTTVPVFAVPDEINWIK